LIRCALLATARAGSHEWQSVASLRLRVREIEKRRERVGVVVAARRSGRVLHTHGGFVQQLVHDALRNCVDELWSVGVELIQLAFEPLVLALAYGLAEAVQRRDERCDLASRTFSAVALDLRSEDLTHLADLAAAQLRRSLRKIFEVVEVEQRDIV